MKTQFGTIILASDLCVLCGEKEATTKEHIPPRALFLESPKDYLAVPACFDCNNSTKLDDEYLRQVMAGGSLVGEGVDVWKKKVLPKLKEFPKTRLGLRKQLSVADLRISSKEAMRFPVLIVNRERIEKSIKKMIYGLYWFHTGSILSKNAEFQMNMFNPSSAEFLGSSEYLEFFNQTKLGIYQDAHIRKTFFYTGAISASISLWYFFFYKQNILMATAKV